MIKIVKAKLKTRTGDPIVMVTRSHVKVRHWLNRLPPLQHDDSSADKDDPEYKIKASWS
jgi:hypothetical protein